MSDLKNRFYRWQMPKFDENGMTKWNWICQGEKGLKLGKNTDIGAFTYINARAGVEIQENVQIGSHCSIYSVSTIDKKQGRVTICKNAKVGSHSTIMPGVTIGKNSIIGAYSFVKIDVPENSIVFGVPAKIICRVGK